MKLELKAKHFKETGYHCDRCAMGKAYSELTGANPVMGDDWLEDGGKTYEFELYDYHYHFIPDLDRAYLHNWDETVIRTIELTEV